jgi:hypothetical protein
MGLARMVFQTVAEANLKAATGAGVGVSKIRSLISGQEPERLFSFSEKSKSP